MLENICNPTCVSCRHYFVAVNSSCDLNDQLCALSDLEAAEVGILGAFAEEHQNEQMCQLLLVFFGHLKRDALEPELAAELGHFRTTMLHGFPGLPLLPAASNPQQLDIAETGLFCFVFPVNSEVRILV